MKKNKHPSPREYRVRYKINGSVAESVQYYNVFHSSEAVHFLYHTFESGHIHGDDLKITAVEEYNKYSDKWEDRTNKAVSHSKIDTLKIIDSVPTLKRRNKVDKI